jgi:hypothetical protein
MIYPFGGCILPHKALAGHEMTHYRSPTGSQLKVFTGSLEDNLGTVIGSRTRADFVVECRNCLDWWKIKHGYQCLGTIILVQFDTLGSRGSGLELG